jgi:hypothetical protein
MMNSFKEEYYLDRIDELLLNSFQAGLITKKIRDDLQDKAYSYNNLACALIFVQNRIDDYIQYPSIDDVLKHNTRKKG